MKKAETTRFIQIMLLAACAMLALACLGGGQATGEAVPSAHVLLQSGDVCRKGLLQSPEKRKFRENWLACIGTYSRIYTLYPDKDESAWALYHAARLYRDMFEVSRLPSDIDEALKLFQRLLDQYPDHRLADDALFGMADIHETQRKDFTQAYLEYLKVTIRYPTGDMRPFASKRLDVLSKAMSRQKDAASSGGKGLASPPEESAPREPDAQPGKTGSGKARVTDIRHWSTPSYTRVVVDLSAPVSYKEHLLKADPDANKPRRFYLDLVNAVVPAEISPVIPIKDDLLQKARAGQYDKDTVRVVLDMEKVGRYKVFHLYDPFRIVVDIQRLEEKERAAAAPKASAPSKRLVQKGVRKAEKSSKDSVSLARQLGLGVNRIVIDPGHGGKDPGCSGHGGLREKEITLSLARVLAAQIKKELGCEVILTRTKDVYLPLERRTAIANMEKADLFISLHVNAHRDSRVNGLETYFLNMALDESAMMVAARENATSEKSISDLQNILNDLMMNTKINESSRLAYQVQGGMVKRLRRGYKDLKDLGVKQAPFYVLIGAQMPAILVEIGFITNGSERKRLPTATYQSRVAQGIAAGIKSYVREMTTAYKGG